MTTNWTTANDCAVVGSWQILPTPAIDGEEKEGTVQYCRTVYDQDGNTNLLIERDEKVVRWQAERGFAFHQSLRRSLKENLQLLNEHGGERGLSTIKTRNSDADEEDSYTVFECAQNRFAQNHASISQCLETANDTMHSAFGLPSNSLFRSSRNYFSHGFLTPLGRKTDSMRTAIQGNEALYKELLAQVEESIDLMQASLNDETNWTVIADDWSGLVQGPTDPAAAAEMDTTPAALRVKGGFVAETCRFIYFRVHFVRNMVDRVLITLHEIQGDWLCSPQANVI